jgi:hypothetical protein
MPSLNCQHTMLKHHGPTGNKVMMQNITATIHVLPISSKFSGGKKFSGVLMAGQ